VTEVGKQKTKISNKRNKEKEREERKIRGRG
jgi:hypothetical protein